jgi:uncharacterized protein (TIGR02466 family)
MQVDSLFPTLFGVHDVEHHIVEKTIMSVRQWETTDSYKKYVEYSQGENLNTSYHTYHDILSEIKLNLLREEIYSVVKQYANLYGRKLEFMRVDSWINYFQPGNYEAEHNHFGNFISGVYYVQAMPNSGDIQFNEPAKQKDMWQGLNTQLKSPHKYQPKTGRMLLFPSFVDHMVHRNTTSSTRISIAFNIPMEK